MKKFLDRFPKLGYIKRVGVEKDACLGYFQGFDGRYVKIPGDDEGTRAHLAMAGYLQSGEKIVMARAMQIWYPQLKKERVPFWLVNWVHDEWQTETIREYGVALHVAEVQRDAIAQAGEDLGLRCPMAGSILNGHNKVAIGDTWMETH